MKNLILVIATIFIGVIVSCNSSGNKSENDEQTEVVLTANAFTAVPMPSTLSNGDPFPLDSTTLNGWVANSSETNNIETNQNIINHGWALWQALTAFTDQQNNGQSLRRFETWYTPGDIIAAYNLRQTNAAAKLIHQNRNTGILEKPNQFHAVPTNPADSSVVGFVKYDPTAAEHAFENRLFYASVLETYLESGQIGNIPDFPSSSVTLKPVFSALKKPDANGNYSIPVWPGEPDTPIPFGPSDWNTSVTVTTSGDSDPEKNIYSVNDFINFKLDSAQAKFEGASVGDYAVLLGIHVTTRENKRWTWQTFWWSKNPDAPFAPSSDLIGSLRPSGDLDQGANHYAMAIGYNMIVPTQPYNGGSNEGSDKNSLYPYNPYLEAGFNDSTFFQGNDSVRLYYSKESQMVNGYMNLVGIETNCMSCHSQARYFKNSTSSLQLYLADQYVPLDAKYFQNSVKLDFAWSIQGNLIDDDGNLIE